MASVANALHSWTRRRYACLHLFVCTLQRSSRKRRQPDAVSIESLEELTDLCVKKGQGFKAETVQLHLACQCITKSKLFFFNQIFVLGRIPASRPGFRWPQARAGRPAHGVCRPWRCLQVDPGEEGALSRREPFQRRRLMRFGMQGLPAVRSLGFRAPPPPLSRDRVAICTVVGVPFSSLSSTGNTCHEAHGIRGPQGHGMPGKGRNLPPFVRGGD